MSPVRTFRALPENIIRVNSSSHLFQDIYETYPDRRYVGIYNFFTPVLLIRDLELYKQIILTDHDVFHAHSDIMPPGLDPLWSKNVVALNNQHAWRNMRAALTPLFTSTKLKTSFTVIKQFSANFIDYLMTESMNENTVVEMNEVCKRLLCEASTTFSFGVHSGAINNPDSKMYSMVKEMMMFSALGGYRRLVDKIFPKLLQWTGAKIYSKEVRNFFTNVMRQSVKMQRENNATISTVTNTILQLHKIEKSHIDELDGNALEDTMAQALILMFAGTETIANILSSLIYQLTIHDDIQKKLYDEIVKTIKDFDVSYHNITSVNYLDDVVNEIIRLCPPNAIIDRQAMEHCVIKPKNPDEKTLIVEKGMTVWVLTQAIQMDTKYFSNPKLFDPDRFSKKNRQIIEPFSFTPFGSGPRICPGYRYGILIIKLVITELLLNFELLPTEKTYIDHACNMYNIKQHGVWIKLNPRKKN